MPQMKKSLPIWSGLVAVSSLVLLLVSGCGEKKLPPPVAPQVEVANVVVKDVPIVREWVGTTDGLVNAKINAQVQGYLTRQNYKEGSLVKKGQVLFEIDPRPFQAALEQAKGQLAVAEGQLYTAKANLEKIRPLAAVNAVSKKDLDDAIGRDASARAAVQAAKAALQKTQIDLSFTRITSPINGIAGIAKAQLGELVGKPGGPELTTVSTVDPIKVYIPLSEQEYMRFTGKPKSEAKVRPGRSQASSSSWPTAASFPIRAGSPLRTARWTRAPVPSKWPPSFPIPAMSCAPGSLPRSGP